MGISFVPIGTKGPRSSEVHGGSLWGSGTLAGDGTKQPSAFELNMAEFQGTEFGNLMKRLKIYSEQKAEPVNVPAVKPVENVESHVVEPVKKVEPPVKESVKATAPQPDVVPVEKSDEDMKSCLCSLV